MTTIVQVSLAEPDENGQKHMAVEFDTLKNAALYLSDVAENEQPMSISINVLDQMTFRDAYARSINKRYGNSA